MTKYTIVVTNKNLYKILCCVIQFITRKPLYQITSDEGNVQSGVLVKININEEKK